MNSEVEKNIKQLYDNRILETNEEFELFEDAINKLSNLVSENDIPMLCTVFDDHTSDEETMFGLIHLIEQFNGEKALQFTAFGISNMIINSKRWAKILSYRILNDDATRKLYGIILKKMDISSKEKLIKLLIEIQNEDAERFKEKIEEII